MNGYRSFVALGDSFTEGMNDPAVDGPGADPAWAGRYRGWAD
ncbi:SGNH/GDSL hydrolase family protein, partial [Streptosporangium canum]